MRRYFISLLWVSIIILLWIGVYWQQLYIDANFTRQHIEKMLYLPSGKFLKPLCLGFDEVVADLLWMKAVVYFGGHARADQHYPWLYHILDLTCSGSTSNGKDIEYIRENNKRPQLTFSIRRT